MLVITLFTLALICLVLAGFILLINPTIKVLVDTRYGRNGNFSKLELVELHEVGNRAIIKFVVCLG